MATDEDIVSPAKQNKMMMTTEIIITALRTWARIGGSDAHQIQGTASRLGKIIVVVVVVVTVVLMTSVMGAAASVRSVTSGHGSRWEK